MSQLRDEYGYPIGVREGTWPHPDRAARGGRRGAWHPELDAYPEAEPWPGYPGEERGPRDWPAELYDDAQPGYGHGEHEAAYRGPGAYRQGYYPDRAYAPGYEEDDDVPGYGPAPYRQPRRGAPGGPAAFDRQAGRGPAGLLDDTVADEEAFPADRPWGGRPYPDYDTDPAYRAWEQAGAYGPSPLDAPEAPGYGAFEEPDLSFLEEDELELESAPARARPRPARAPARSRPRQQRQGTALFNASNAIVALLVFAVTAGFCIILLTGRVITMRQLLFMAHATAGIIVVHAFGGGLVALCARRETPFKDLLRKVSTVAMALASWVAVLIGTWFGYPGYRANPPAGAADLDIYAQEFLQRTPALAFWDYFAMEWKVHGGWLTPFLNTVVAFIALRYGRQLMRDDRLKKMVTCLFILGFTLSVMASVLGAFVNTIAPNEYMTRAFDP